MIKILLSSRVIKRARVDDIKDRSPLIETKFQLAKEELLVKKESLDKEEVEGEEYKLEEIEEDIRQDLLNELEGERKKIINDAKVEADKIKLQARKEGYNLGYKEGRELGYREGIDKSQEEGRIIKDKALNLIKESEEQVDKYLEENKDEIINLSVNIAEAIVHSTIDRSSEDILSLVRPILERYDRKDNIIITCHPENYPNLMENLDKLENICPESRFIILQDANLERNGCTIENKDQVIDLQIRKQLETVLDEIKNME